MKKGYAPLRTPNPIPIVHRAKPHKSTAQIYNLITSQITPALGTLFDHLNLSYSNIRFV